MGLQISLKIWDFKVFTMVVFGLNPEGTTILYTQLFISLTFYLHFLLRGENRKPCFYFCLYKDKRYLCPPKLEI